ncbi:inactive rhomboid protein 1-like isoform X1 [Orbicella faveolata]|uniref:inactive rhomboid protein 1-like isoform X1 n=1 Tax=Orbicella faveolata TaxID=48498 RepID=UPI0009E433DF|nr:inactive rhomboid protein 1-like isoform X1 [Orbicella faveolata]
MEREPLLGGRNSGHSSGHRYVQYSQPPSSDGSVETSVYSYCGDNYVIPPDRRKSRSLTVDTQASIDESPPRRFHWPLFICLVTLAHVGVLLYICIAGGVEKIGYKSTLEHMLINKFGYIGSHERNDSVHKQNISRYTGVNVFIGPNSSFLVHVGAKFVPCMKKLTVMEERIAKIAKQEADFGCCSFRGECGMMLNASCPGVIIRNCSSGSLNCTNGITLRPCCLGLHSQCEVTSEQSCIFRRGHWYKDKMLCSDVNCLDGICGMTGVKHKTGGHQGYRLITPIFLHLGVLHLIMNLFFQVPVGMLIEREIGTVRMALIYLISGIGGNLICGLFSPLTPQAGASGALFGLIGLLIIKLLQLRHEVKRPCVEALILLGVVLVSFALGTLPYIGNFVHIGGFFFGLFASLVFLPRLNFRCQSLAIYLSFKVVAFAFLFCVIVATSLAFFFIKSANFCWWCQYIDCVPYTEHFCPTMNEDGFLNGS